MSNARDCLTQGFTNYGVRAVLVRSAGLAGGGPDAPGTQNGRGRRLVLSTGLRPSEYAAHLLEIARHFGARAARRRPPHCPSIGTRKPFAFHRGFLAPTRPFAPGGGMRRRADRRRDFLRRRRMQDGSANQSRGTRTMPASIPSKRFERLKLFFAAKEKQARTLASQDGKTLFPEVESYFAAGKKGDWEAVDRLWTNYFRRPRLSNTSAPRRRWTTTVSRPRYWQTTVETWGAWECIHRIAPKYTQIMADDEPSIPFPTAAFTSAAPTLAGSYFGAVRQDHKSRAIHYSYHHAKCHGRPLNICNTCGSCMAARSRFPPAKRVRRHIAILPRTPERWLRHDQDFPNEPSQIKPGENVSKESGLLQ